MNSRQSKRLVLTLFFSLPFLVLFQNCSTVPNLGDTSFKSRPSVTQTSVESLMLKQLSKELERANLEFATHPTKNEFQAVQFSDYSLHLVTRLSEAPFYELKMSLVSNQSFAELALAGRVQIDRFISKLETIQQAINNDGFKVRIEKEAMTEGFVFRIGAAPLGDFKLAEDLTLSFDCKSLGRNRFAVTARDELGVIFSNLTLDLKWESGTRASDELFFSSDAQYYSDASPEDRAKNF